MLQYKQGKLLCALAFISAISNSYANPNEHYLITKSCLTQNINKEIRTLAREQDFVFIRVDDAARDALIAAKTQLRDKCSGFIDVSYEWLENKQAQPMATAQYFLKMQLAEPKFIAPTYKVRYEKQTNALLKTLNPQNMWADLTKLTSFKDRYANSNTGIEAAQWIKNQVIDMAKLAKRDDVTVWEVPTGSYKQPSIVAKIGKGDGSGIVIGGHMDTLSGQKKPGADDDGTGSVTVLETARTLINSDLRFQKPIYVIWYSAEELGLIGSSYVVRDFKNKKIPVDAVMQLDMTGYAYKNETTMWLLSDYVNQDLTRYLENLITTYVQRTVKYTRCGYGCSDHASWHKNGFPASAPFEAQFGHEDPYIHTSNDTMDHLSLDHMHDYAKLAVAFAVELAEPVV